MGKKEKIVRNLKRETLLRLASSASREPSSTKSTKRELVEVIMKTMSVEEIKNKLRVYQVSRKRMVLPILLLSMVVFSSLTIGLSIAFTSTSPEDRISYLLSTQWEKTYENTDFNQTVILQRTNDSGYLMAAGILPRQGPMIASIKKLDAFGNVQWNLTIKANYPSSPCSIQPTSDRGYIIAGTTFDTSNWTYPWLVKVDSDGRIQWNNTYKEPYNQIAAYACQAPDGGFIVSGYNYGQFIGTYSFWFLRTNSNGSLWQSHSSTLDAKTFCGQQTSDGGCIIALTQSLGWTATIILVKLDPTGGMSWWHYYPFPSDLAAYSFGLTSDGGYVVTGAVKNNPISNGLFILKIGPTGDSQWNKTYYGVGFFTCGRSVQQTFDGGYIVVGYTRSYNTLAEDAWLLKVDSNGIVQWNKTLGGIRNSEAQSILQTSSDGYIFAGVVESYDGSHLRLESVEGSVSIFPSSRSMFVGMTVLVTILLTVGCAGLLIHKKKLRVNSSEAGGVTS